MTLGWVFIWRTDAQAETPTLWPPHVKRWRLGKTLMLGGIRGRRRRGQQRMRWLDGITDSWTGRPGVLRFMGSQRVGHDWATELKCVVRCGVRGRTLSSHDQRSFFQGEYASRLWNSHIFLSYFTLLGGTGWLMWARGVSSFLQVSCS